MWDILPKEKTYRESDQIRRIDQGGRGNIPKKHQQQQRRSILPNASNPNKLASLISNSMRAAPCIFPSVSLDSF